MGPDVLPRWERGLYCVGGILSLLYSYYSLYRESQDNARKLELQPGLRWLGGKKDADDLEWKSFITTLPQIALLLLGHFLIGQFLFMLKLKIWYQKTLRLLYDLLAISLLFGVRATLLCFVESLVMYAVTFQGSTITAWIVGLFLTASLNQEWIFNGQIILVGYDPFNDNFLLTVGLSYVHIRLISSSIEIINQRKLSCKTPSALYDKSYTRSAPSTHNKSVQASTKDHPTKGDENNPPAVETSITDFLCYIFYFPIFFQGTILTFDEFSPQLTSFYTCDKHSYNYRDILKRIAKIILYTGVIEFQSHFMYLSAIQMNSKLIRKFSLAATAGYCVYQGQYFYFKYLCFFGLGSVGTLLDGLTPPPLPSCTIWVYSFTDMWKYFDVGLYRFIKKYIYIPWGGSKAGVARQICGTISAFLFIYYWHGAEPAIFVWCLGNLIVIILEMSATSFESSQYGSNLKRFLGPATMLRLRAAVAAPMYVASGIQIMFFFFNMRAGRAIADGLFFKLPWKSVFYEFIGFYLGVQNGILARQWVIGRSEKQVK